MAKYFVLDKHLYKMCCNVPTEAPQLDSRPPEPDRQGSGAAQTLGAPGQQPPLPGTSGPFWSLDIHGWAAL